MSRAPDGKLTSFLNKADDLYISAFTQRKYSYLFKDFTREVQEAVMNYVNNNYLERDFAIKKCRYNEWEIIDCVEKPEGEEIKLLKTQRFKKIHVSLLRTISASQDYTEIWKVLDTGRSQYTVTFIGNFELL